MTRPALTAALAAGLLAGCVAGPAPRIATPTPQMPATYSYAPDGDEAASLAGLLPLRDPAFQSLWTAAMADAPTLAEASARIDRARAAVRRAGAERGPQVDAGGSADWRRTNPDAFAANLPPGISIDPNQTSYGSSISGQWDVDLFGRLRTAERAAQLRFDASGDDAGALRNAMKSELAVLVIDWRTLGTRQLALAEDAAAAARLVQIADSRVRAGLASEVEQARSQSNASAISARLASLSTERSAIVGRLVTLTGRDAAWVAGQLAQPAGDATRLTPPAAMPSALLTRRPDVRAAANRLAAADAELAATAARRFPRLTLSGSLGLLAYGPASLLASDSLVGTLATAIAAPILDFGRVAADIDAAEADKAINFQSFRAAAFTALGDAEAAYGLIDARDATAVALARESAQLMRNESLAASRFDAGIGDLAAVLEARRLARAARERMIIADGEAQRARVLLWLALGGGD